MKNQTVLLVGATGLVGGECLKELQNADFCSRIIVLTRNPLDNISDYTKAEQHVVDFNEPDSYSDLVKCDIAVCALGTTMKKAGSKEAFYKVDYTYSLDAAKAAKKGGARHVLLVSAMGASQRSAAYYNRVKGDLEHAVMELGFDCVSILRPSLIMGDRNEFRLAEETGKFFMKAFGFLIPRKYRGIHASVIARAIVRRAENPDVQSRVLESHEIWEAGK